MGSIVTRPLKAFVRFDGSGRIVAGSLILRKNKPKVGKWKEIPAYECCNYVPGPPIVGCSTFYINQVVNPETPGDLYSSAGAAMDTNCNTFFPLVNYWVNPANPNGEISGQNNILQKYAENGNLIWEKGFDYPNLPAPYTFMEIQTLTMVDNANNLIVPLYTTAYNPEVGQKYPAGLTKFDNNGVHLWSILMESDPLLYANYPYEFIYDLKVDSSNNIYILTGLNIDGVGILNLRKISPLGVVLESKSIKATSGTNEGFINITSNGDIYLTFFEYTSTTSNILKLDSGLSQIWHKTIDGADGQSYMYGAQLDPQENLVFFVGNGAGLAALELNSSYVKISSDGDILWTTKLLNTVNPTYALGTYQLDTDSNGNVYASSIYPSLPIPGYTAVGGDPLIVAKLDNNGTYQWAYIIDVIGDGFDSWYNYTPISGKIVNNTLVLGYYGDGGDAFNAQLLKLPLTQLTPGTYGDYVITDVTDLWSPSNPVIILNDEDSIVIDEVPLTVTDLDYIEFANPTTITKTLLS